MRKQLRGNPITLLSVQGIPQMLRLENITRGGTSLSCSRASWGCWEPGEHHWRGHPYSGHPRDAVTGRTSLARAVLLTQAPRGLCCEAARSERGGCGRAAAGRGMAVAVPAVTI